MFFYTFTFHVFEKKILFRFFLIFRFSRFKLFHNYSRNTSKILDSVHNKIQFNLLVSTSIDWLIDWFFHLLIDSVISSSIDWLIATLAPLTDYTYWLIDWLIFSFIDWLIATLAQLTDYTYWLIDWLIQSFLHRLIDWLIATLAQLTDYTWREGPEKAWKTRKVSAILFCTGEKNKYRRLYIWYIVIWSRKGIISLSHRITARKKRKKKTKTAKKSAKILDQSWVAWCCTRE